MNQYIVNYKKINGYKRICPICKKSFMPCGYQKHLNSHKKMRL